MWIERKRQCNWNRSHRTWATCSRSILLPFMNCWSQICLHYNMSKFCCAFFVDVHFFHIFAIFCLVLWNIEAKMLNFPALTVNRLFSFNFYQFVSCIWFDNFCCLAHIHLVSLYVLGRLIFLSLYNFLLCYNFICSDVYLI